MSRENGYATRGGFAAIKVEQTREPQSGTKRETEATVEGLFIFHDDRNPRGYFPRDARPNYLEN